MGHYSEICVAELKQLITAKRPVILDLQDFDAYRSGHIQNAIHLEKGQLKIFLNNINKDIPIVTCCSDGNCSDEVAKLLSEYGFKESYSLQGGLEAWTKAESKYRVIRKDLCRWLDDHGYSCEDINRQAFNGETALMFAARQGETEYVIELLDRGADMEIRNNDGNTAVWLACYSNNIFTLSVLIQEGADINVQNDNGATALIYAASASRPEMVELLVSAGADTGLTTLDDFSALDVASTPAIFKLLRKVGKGMVPELTFNYGQLA